MTKTTSQYFSSFLTSEASLARQFHARSRRMAFEGNTREAAVLWQEKARQRLAVLLGLHHFEACEPSAEKVNSVPLDGISREEWRLQTEPDVWMPFYLFVPDRLAQSPGERAPLVLCAHGHGSAGKWATGGRRDIPVMVPVIERYNYDYGLQIARAGFITACPDARGFGQRRELALHNDGQAPDYLFASSCSHLTLSGTPLGPLSAGDVDVGLDAALEFSRAG
jgi:hypothetical protein